MLLADPPIDWAKVHSASEYRPYRIRDEFAAALIEREILAKDKKALLIFGDSHLWKALPAGIAYFRCKAGALFDGLCSFDTRTNAVSMQRISAIENIDSFALSPDGTKAALLTTDIYATQRVRRLSLIGRPGGNIMYEAAATGSPVALGKGRLFQWKSFDGLKLRGLLVLPVDYRPGDRSPLIVDLHGGPMGGIALSGSVLNSGPLEWQLWAAKGYAVFIADYRESGVYGFNPRYFQRPAAGLLHDDDAEDVLSGVHQLVRLGYADPRRMALIGHSAGSYVTNAILARSNLFAAAISYEGASDWKSLRMNPLRRRFYAWLFNVPGEGLSREFDCNSVLREANKIRTPLLYVSGQPTREVGRRLVAAINAAGGRAVLLDFPDEGHVVRGAQNLRLLLDTSVEWIDSAFNEATARSGQSYRAEPVTLFPHLVTPNATFRSTI